MLYPGAPPETVAKYKSFKDVTIEYTTNADGSSSLLINGDASTVNIGHGQNAVAIITEAGKVVPLPVPVP